MGRQKIVHKDVELGQLINDAGHRSRSSAGKVWARNHTLHRPSRNDSFVFNSRLDAAGKFAGSLIGGAFLQIGGTWNQYFAVAQRNLPAASLDLRQKC